MASYSIPSGETRGPGPGSRLLHALVAHWGVELHAQPQPEPTHILTPQWWRTLMQGAELPRQSGWVAQWKRAQPAGDWAPNALVVMTHTRGGTLAVDLDLDDEGNRPAWWLEGNTLIRAAEDLEDLTLALEQGPSHLEKLVSTPPTLDATPIDEADLPFDPISRKWQDSWDREAPTQAWALDRAGQGLILAPGWKRHPTLPLVVLPDPQA